ncbi:two-component system, OmpR family, phosphate regulon sensor histidine kinase PhoR [Aquiflexum balticum DSM 16537]|uniref:histidine kinase n=1 Tax=Aquiflexum balticum DSM 16537 TaxID=758820 RepID=A0A1W2GZP3_9BACT|nr:HAMP domain-containing sensor histidine kinase [Aquiflexum balticum]SMD42091.1 two-component system, OmpR family, phosphate regulon sensor histidine kinase PhoR [Aquiflexum balticum DSM 16537]
MSKSKMKLIIVLMSIASIGLIGFQYYWVSNALRINEERFEQTVYQSLAATVSQIDKGETSDIFLSYLAKDTLLQQSMFQRIEPIVVQVRQRPINTRRPSMMDSILQQQIPQISQSFRRLIESRGVDLSVFSDLDNFFTYLTPEIASTIFTPDEMEILLQERERQYQYLNQAETTFRRRYGINRPSDYIEEYNVPKDALEKIRNANIKIEFMNRAWEELLEGQRDVLSRMDTSQLRKYLKNNLKERGIGESFDLGILDDKGMLIPISSLIDSSRLVSNGIQARLFPSDILGKENYLVVHFPTKKAYIFRQIWLPVLSSLLFIGIVIFCFIYAIKVIIRQKKLSDIKNDFINNMTHEFKTPIATVSLAVEALQDPELLNQESFRKRYLSIIKDENTRLGSQVEKVLQSATLDKKDFKLKLEKVNMDDILENARQHIGLQVENKGGKIELLSELKEPYLEADSFHISHIINNLLDNAIKYAKDKPNIEIKSWDQNGSLFVSVKDNGIGMSKESVKKIFDKFYRVPTGNLHDVKGFGLGLAYVKTMTEAHKGEITVNSEPGKGSIFTLKLPKKQ